VFTACSLADLFTAYPRTLAGHVESSVQPSTPYDSQPPRATASPSPFRHRCIPVCRAECCCCCCCCCRCGSWGRGGRGGDRSFKICVWCITHLEHKYTHIHQHTHTTHTVHRAIESNTHTQHTVLCVQRRSLKCARKTRRPHTQHTT
jgi:hypothetical protein